MGILANGTHEIFVQKWHETDNKSEAYRIAYPLKVAKWKDETIHNKASALSKLGEVVARYGELKQDSADNHGVTIATLLAELEQARALAMGAETPQSSAAVSATMSKAKLVGLDINRTVTVELSHEDWLDSLK